VATWIDGPINFVGGLAAMSDMKLIVQDLHESLEHRRVRYNGKTLPKTSLERLDNLDLLVYHSSSNKLVRKTPDAEALPVWLDNLVKHASCLTPRQGSLHVLHLVATVL
jgi:hypothetical protein